MSMAKRADWSGWRRRACSADRWELVVTLNNCTQGEIWEALQQECFRRVPVDAEIGRKWDYAITLASQRPTEAPARLNSSGRPFHEGYHTKVVRPK